MPETQLLKFRQKYPQYDKLTDAAVLTRIHQKHYSKISYDEFVGKFEGKYGGKTPTQPQQDNSFLAKYPDAKKIRQKGLGYFGSLPTTDGTKRTSTELSIGVEWDGIEREIPSLVPTLSPDEIDHMLSGKKPTESIVEKSVAYARSRMKEGKDVWAQQGEQRKRPVKPKSFLDVVYDRVAKEPLKIALDSPVAAGTELVGNAVDFIAQKLPTAALPFGSFTEGKDETFLQKLGRGKTPGEFVPEFVPVRTPVGTVSTDVVRPIVDFFGDIFWAAGPVLSIAKRLRAGTTVTKYNVSKVRGLLETVPEAKQLGALSDDAILQVIKEGQAVKTGEGFAAKGTSIPQKQLPLTKKGLPEPGGFFAKEAGSLPKSRRLTEGKTIFKHAEGIVKSTKKVNALKDPKGTTKTKVTQGKFPKAEKETKIPEFTAKTRPQDAKTLGEKLIGDNRAIRKLEELVDINSKEFDRLLNVDFEKAKLAAHKKSMYNEALEVAKGEGGAADFWRKSGKDYTKGLFNAAKDDITSKSSGIISDPYRNVRKFLKENKLELTQDEMAKINNFARKLAKETLPEATRIKRFEEFLKKDFKKIKFETGVTPLEKIAKVKPIESIAKPSGEKFKYAIDQSRKEFEELNKTTIKKVYQFAKRKIVDVSGNIKKELNKTPQGKQAVIRHDLVAGAHPRATRIFNEKRSLIFKGLDKNEITTLDDMIDARRTITIDSYKEGVKHRQGVTGADAQKYLDSLPSKVKAKLQPRINEYFKSMRETLKKRLDEGLISKEQFDELVKHDYSPRKFIQYAGEQQYSIGGKVINVPNSGLKSLAGGSEQAMQTNSHVLLSDVINQTENIIARNRANKSLLKLVEDVPNNGIIQLEKKSGWAEINVMVDGKQKSMYMPNELAQEWVKSSPEVAADMANFIGWASGSKILKPMATGLNPEFALANFPRDIAHVWFSDQTRQYSSFLLKYAAQMGRDLAGGIKNNVLVDALLKKGQFLDYIKEGGGMEFLTHQGKITSKTGGVWKSLQDVLGYFGETSEVMVRLAMRKRALRNGLSAEEATWVARNYLDFSQGGSWAKGLDTALPYLNAGIQGTRGVFRHAATNPAIFTWKVAQLGSVASGLYWYNSQHNANAWDEIPMRDKVNNWIITTPFKYTNKNGDERYYYVKIAKDQAQRVFASIFENLMAKAAGKEIDPEQIVASIQEALPIVPTQNLPPTLKMAVGYAANIDFWRSEKIWRGAKVEAGSERTKYTEPFFVALGDKTGVSPARSQYVAEQLFTSGNLYTNLGGGAWNTIMKETDRKTQNFVTEEMILKQPFVRRVLKSTNPFEKHRKQIEEADIKSNTKRYNLTFEFDKKTDEYFNGKIDKQGIIEHIKGLGIDTSDKRSLLRRFKKHTRIGNIPNRRLWVSLSYLSPKARAYVFYAEWVKKSDEDKKAFLKTAIDTRIATTDFKREFSKLKKE